MERVVLPSISRIIVRFLDNNLLCLLLCTDTRELDEFDACSTYGVGPVDGPFGVRNSTSNFIQEVGRWNRTVERGYQVRRESIECLGLVIRRRIKRKREEYPGKQADLIWLPIPFQVIRTV